MNWVQQVAVPGACSALFKLPGDKPSEEESDEWLICDLIDNIREILKVIES